MTLDAQAALPTPRETRRQFDRAAASFDAAKPVHDEARLRLLERLDFLAIGPRRLVDVGCATADGAAALAGRYPDAAVIALDASVGMLRAARAKHGRDASFAAVGGDAEHLPFADGSVDLLLANLVLPWCLPDRVFAEARRVLGPDGLLLFSTLGPDTLAEVREAWAAADDRIHVHACFDMHDLGDMLAAAGLEEPVIDVDRIAVTYPGAAALVADLRACGAVNIAHGRRRTLTGKARWRRFEAALAARTDTGRLTVGVELILGHAWRGAATPQSRSKSGEVRIPADRLLRRPRQ